MADYPKSKQWREGRFHNPPEWPQRLGLSAVLRWQRRRRSPTDAGFVPPQVANDGQRLRDNATEPSVTWSGHATLLLQAEGMSVLTDPMFAPGRFAVKRLAPPGLRRSI